MLEAMRKGAQNIFVKAFLLLLASTFVLWGVGDMFRGRTQTIVASVGDIAISNVQFSNALRRETSRYQQALGRALTEEQIEQFGIRRRVLNQLINSRLAMLRTDGLGLKVGDSAVKEQLINNGVFFNEDGQFSKENFSTVLRASGISEENYISSVKQDTAIQLLLDTLITPPEAFDVQAQALFNYRNEQRLADLLALSPDRVQKVEDPVETDLVQFYQENSRLFSMPEYREVTYFTFGLDNIKGSLKIDDEELRAQYQADIERYKVPEARDVDQYVFETEVAAIQGQQKLLAGEKLAGVEKVSMGMVTEDGLLEGVQEAVFTAEKGEYTAPVQSSLGWHVFIVNDIIDPRVKPFPEVKEAIAEEMMESQAGEEFEKFVNQIEDTLAEGKTMEEVAKQYDFILHKVNAVDANGRGTTEKELVDLPEKDVFLPLVFEQDAKTVSPLTFLSNDTSYLVARVDSITPQRVKALDEVQGNVITLWKEKRKQEKLFEMASVVAQKLGEGQEPKKLAKELKLTLKEKQVIRRPAGGQSFVAVGEAGEPVGLAQELFTLREGQNTKAYRAADGSFVVGVLRGINPAQADDASSEMAQIQESLKESFADDILAQYNDYLRSKIKVTINEEVWRTAF